MKFNSERTTLPASKKNFPLNTFENSSSKEFEPLLYKIATSFGFSNRESDDLLTQVNVYPKSFCAAYESFDLRIALSKIMVYKCIFKISSRLFSQNISFRIMPHMFGYYAGFKDYRDSDLRYMPLSFRTVYILKNTIGFNENEIAEILNITSIKVKERFQKAKTLLDS